tara:strand:- start:299 stop:481 length:183 start_codon:yes stop_codon:yes gene_type:complete
VGAAVGLGDSLDKNRRINEIETRIEKLEKANEIKKPKPYVPSYVDMETWKKGLYNGEPRK